MANLTSIQPVVMTLIVLAAFVFISVLFIILILRNQKRMKKDKYMLINDEANLNEVLRLMDYRIKNQKEQIYFTLLLLSIDDYDNVKDIINEEGAKEYLTKVKEAIRKTLPVGAKMAQTEEKESFLIYLPEYYKEEGMQDVAQVFKSNAEKTFLICNSIPMQKTASVAVTAYPAQGNDVVTLINNLLVSIYKAKKAGGNEMIYYSPELEKDRKYTERYKDIKQCLDKGKIVLRYNPIIHMEKGILNGAEIVINKADSYGNISPIENFTEYLEEYNDEFWFTTWSMEKSLLLNKDIIRSEQANGFFLTLKAGFKFLTNPNAALKLQNSIERYNMDANNVILEVEDVLENELGNRFVKNLMQIQGVGIRIAARVIQTDKDLSKLIEKFDVDLIKLGVEDVLDDKQKSVQDLLKLAFNYRKKIIVTNVQNEEQLEKLKNKTIAYVQGPYYGASVSNTQLVKQMQI
jgi:EAL domain-containing protein (putative c-di-GMP-specific phosphodiesterase class I)/GGDEF domain-containing protein